ncbi:S1 family peptidase [Massilia sp. PWRC2]|uniref:S1 family peptidase n=1 Tax=Massilia sp. PWRC2 TaxID=2804626 RepID=UPI003CED6B4E
MLIHLLQFRGTCATNRFGRGAGLAVMLGCLLLGSAHGADLPAVVAAFKPSVVGVGSFVKTRSPAVNFSGTGFVVGDGLSVITNAHVVPDVIDTEKREALGVLVRRGNETEFRAATVVAIDKTHDLAHLRLTGAPLPAVKLGQDSDAAEGMDLVFTGFPLGMVLGLHPATHRALLAAITPIVMPSLSSKSLDVRMIAQLQRPPFQIYQLDGTAYPGNSGSPVYDPGTGVVLAVINMTFVKGLKETAITNPSGISYAIPVSYVRDLLQQK